MKRAFYIVALLMVFGIVFTLGLRIGREQGAAIAVIQENDK